MLHEWRWRLWHLCLRPTMGSDAVGDEAVLDRREHIRIVAIRKSRNHTINESLDPVNHVIRGSAGSFNIFFLVLDQLIEDVVCGSIGDSWIDIQGCSRALYCWLAERDFVWIWWGRQDVQVGLGDRLRQG